jgi:hypothetical protein
MRARSMVVVGGVKHALSAEDRRVNRTPDAALFRAGWGDGPEASSEMSNGSRRI